MRICIFIIAGSLVLATASAAPVPKELKKNAALNGHWKLQSIVINGQPSTFGANDTDWVIGEDFQLVRQSADGTARMVAVPLKIDKTNRNLDWGSAGQNPFLGKYEIEGDTLIVCIADQNQPRPKTVAADPQTYVWTLRRK